MSPPQQLRQQTSNCCSLLIYRPQKDERLSWPSWLTYSGWLTHISGHPSATSRVVSMGRLENLKHIIIINIIVIILRYTVSLLTIECESSVQLLDASVLVIHIRLCCFYVVNKMYYRDVLCCAYYAGESLCEVKTEADSSDHTEHSHDDKSRPYLCTVCDKRFLQKRHLIRHSMLHNSLIIIMAALCNRGAIIFLPCGFFLLSIFYLLSFFLPCLIPAATDWMSTILLHMAWP